MKITCSILCHNYGRYLRQAIVSCIEQELSPCDVDVLVIDDGSTDNTQEVCREFLGQIRVVRSVQALGFGASLDRAISEAAGDYVCLLDADDYFAPTKIKSLLHHIERGCLFIQDTPEAIDENGQKLMANMGPGCTSTICIQRKAALTMLPVMNELFFHPIRMAGQSADLPDKLTMYRIHPRSMLRTTKPAKWYRHLAEVTKQLADRLMSMKSSPPFWVKGKKLTRIASDFRSVAAYNALEASLFEDRYFRALCSIPAIFVWAAVSDRGLSTWHLRVAARAVLNRKLRRHESPVNGACNHGA